MRFHGSSSLRGWRGGLKTTHHAELDRAEGVELPVWQAPNDDVRPTLNGDHAKIIFEVWDDQAKYSSHCGVLEFSQMWGMRCERNKIFLITPTCQMTNTNLAIGSYPIHLG